MCPRVVVTGSCGLDEVGAEHGQGDGAAPAGEADECGLVAPGPRLVRGHRSPLGPRDCGARRTLRGAGAFLSRWLRRRDFDAVLLALDAALGCSQLSPRLTVPCLALPAGTRVGPGPIPVHHARCAVWGMLTCRMPDRIPPTNGGPHAPEPPRHQWLLLRAGSPSSRASRSELFDRLKECSAFASRHRGCVRTSTHFDFRSTDKLGSAAPFSC